MIRIVERNGKGIFHGFNRSWKHVFDKLCEERLPESGEGFLARRALKRHLPPRDLVLPRRFKFLRDGEGIRPRCVLLERPVEERDGRVEGASKGQARRNELPQLTHDVLEPELAGADEVGLEVALRNPEHGGPLLRGGPFFKHGSLLADSRSPRTLPCGSRSLAA